MQPTLIVIIEDDPALLKLQGKVLRLAGYQTEGWSRMAGAVELIRASQPALVLLDMQLDQPRAGLKIVQGLKADPVTADIPVLLCCGDLGIVDEHRSTLQEWGVRFALKPIDPETLLKMIAAMLRERG